MNSDLLVKGGTLVTMGPRGIIDGDILIKEGRIVKVGGMESPFQVRVLEVKDRVVIPGLVQTHIHLCQTIFRGMADDLILSEWLQKRIWPLEAAHWANSVYISALVGLSELIRGGTTTVLTMETVKHTLMVFKAARDSGIRAIIGKAMMDEREGLPPGLRETTEESLEESLRLWEDWQGREEGRLGACFAPRFAPSCSEDLLKIVGTESRKRGILIHSHAAETKEEVEIVRKDKGMGEIEYLERLGLTGERLLLAHCVWLGEEEMDILARTKTKVLHCPSSNLKLGSGIANVYQLRQKGVSVSIGADGAACNNNLDAFWELRLASLLQKVKNGPQALGTQEAFRMATLGGAEALGMEREIGSIEEGKRADLVILDLSRAHFLSPDDIYSTLVYSAQASDVEMVLVGGRVIFQGGKVLTIEEDDVFREARAIAPLLQKGAGI